jgi:beta-lactamase class A
MPEGMTRRAAMLGAIAVAPGLAWSPASAAAPDFAALERDSGGRFGVAMLDLQTGRRHLYRADERFALCSTFKFLAAALVLARVDRGRERLDRRIVFAESDLVTYSPITKDHTGPDGMSLGEICEAALTLSDNTAGNLLLDSFGGPPALTAFARALGDRVTRLDRRETALNEAAPGDLRDTTTPAAMLQTMQYILLGRALSASSRAQLTAWLCANETGAHRLRAGLPADWRVGDKTGTGEHGATNDIAILWPPRRAPLLVAVYYADSPATGDERNAVLAQAGRLIAATV